jgi:hypothetical protein
MKPGNANLQIGEFQSARSAKESGVPGSAIKQG